MAGVVLLPDTHPLDVVQGERAGEPAQAAEQTLLDRGQQIMAPVDGRPQRLLARQRRAPAAGEQGEPVGQPVQDLLGR